MDINFDQVRAAARDDVAAKILREKWQLDDRSSASGSVVCDRADIEALLSSGKLEPVLSVDQFLSVSHGKAYGGGSGVATHRQTSSISHAAAGATDGTDWTAHPDYQEYQSLGSSMQEALRHDFASFLFVKRRGALPSLRQTVCAEVERGEAAKQQTERRASVQEAVDTAHLTEPARFAAAPKWAAGKKNYASMFKKDGQ